MNKYLKFLFVFLSLMFVSYDVYSLQVVENPVSFQDQQSQSVSASESTAKLIVGIFIIGGIALAFILGLAFVMFKIYQWLTIYQRKKSDFIYNIFEDDLRQCHVNSDPAMKRRTKRSFGLFFKRAPIFMEDNLGQFVEISRYNGEAFKKEGYYALSLYDKIGLFKIYERVVLIPLSIKDTIFKKVVLDGKKVIVLKCDGFDEVGNTDYYVLPLIRKDEKSDFIDFADKIHKEYFEKKTYRGIIKENLMGYKENVVDAVESNPLVHFKRRSK